MAACRFDVTQGTGALELDFVAPERPNDSGGHPHNEHSGRNLRPRSHHRTGSNQDILANLCTIQDDRSDPDERTVADTAAVYDRAMSDRDLVSQKRRKATGRDMQRRLVLDIRAFTDSDSFHVASQDRPV